MELESYQAATNEKRHEPHYPVTEGTNVTEEFSRKQNLNMLDQNFHLLMEQN